MNDVEGESQSYYLESGKSLKAKIYEDGFQITLNFLDVKKTKSILSYQDVLENIIAMTSRKSFDISLLFVFFYVSGTVPATCCQSDVFPDFRDVRSGEAGEAVPRLKNCAKENENKVYI